MAVGAVQHAHSTRTSARKSLPGQYASPQGQLAHLRSSDTVCMLVVVPEEIWPFMLTTACEEQLCRQHRSKSIKVTAEATSCFTAISSFL